eukprot:scaffold234883_cov31-Tisochrysis_lutea.AAC.4
MGSSWSALHRKDVKPTTASGWSWVVSAAAMPGVWSDGRMSSASPPRRNEEWSSAVGTTGYGVAPTSADAGMPLAAAAAAAAAAASGAAGAGRPAESARPMM